MSNEPVVAGLPVGTSPWLKAQPTIARRPELRLVCFPPAGGGAASFAGLQSAAGRWVEYLTVELPGRASRINDSPVPSVGAAVTEIADAVAADVAGSAPYVLLGQCMGALLAYEVAARLDEQGVPLPMRVVVAGANGPVCDLPDVDDPLGFLRRTGGTPDELFDAPELLEMTLAVLRADLRMIAGYRFAGRVLTVPITVLYGADDDMVEPSGLRSWDGLSSVSVSIEELPGGHFFLDQHYRTLVSQLRREVRRIRQLG